MMYYRTLPTLPLRDELRRITQSIQNFVDSRIIILRVFATNNDRLLSFECVIWMRTSVFVVPDGQDQAVLPVTKRPANLIAHIGRIQRTRPNDTNESLTGFDLFLQPEMPVIPGLKALIQKGCSVRLILDSRLQQKRETRCSRCVYMR